MFYIIIIIIIIIIILYTSATQIQLEVNKINNYSLLLSMKAGPRIREVYGVGLRPFGCYDCGFESRRCHGCFGCFVFSGRSIYYGPITRPEVSY